MKFSTILTSLLPAIAAAHPTSSDKRGPGRKPPAFFLAGDSTVAIDGGWGDGFLTYPRKGAWGVNFAKSGATTRSFVAGGYWKNLTSYVKEYADEYDVYVTLQFGHNDQKPVHNITHDQFEANLEDLANEIKELGGSPILITSLTRRTFTAPNQVVVNLNYERLIAIVAAAETNSPYLDLNHASIDYVNAIGEEASHEYNWAEGDNTHLNDHGGVVFGRMVADLLLKKIPKLSKWIAPDPELSDKINNGEPA